tara:strand:- start:953 stop:2200 length:1248 start_codon:yes stop_codon:yes gene_type:complete
MSLLKINYTNCFNKKNKALFEELISSKDNQSKINNIINNSEFLKIINNYNEIENIKLSSDKFSKDFENICILGTGGSSLGAQALIGILPDCDLKKVFYYFDNIDPIFFEKKINQINLAKTGFIVISKSGSTTETLSQFMVVLKKFEETDLTSIIHKNFIIITEDTKNPINTIGKLNNINILEHNKKIGGRFSIFSNVGLFPACNAGIDIFEFIKGSKQLISDVNDGSHFYHIEGAALSIIMNKLNNMNINALLTYSDALKNFGRWYSQLWSESIGKDGFGTTPVHFIGTTDQHSQIQLYLDGPRDKFFTIIKTNHKNQGLSIESSNLKNTSFDYLIGKKMGDIMEAEQYAITQTIVKNDLPLREIMLDKVNARSLGALMTHFFLETISTGVMLDIDIFNQPAVEQGKKITKDYLF